MKNKFTLCACALAMVAALLTSCKDKTDILATEAEIAQKTFPGIYAFLGIDSVKVSTNMYEWAILNENGKKDGYFRYAATGNMADADVTTNLTWSDATMAENKLSMIIPVDLADNTHKDLVWSDGVIATDGYVTSKNLISMVDVLRRLHEEFANYDLVYDDTTFYITTKLDTVVYLAWKTEVVYYTEEQIDSAKQALVQYHDTLVWFNTTYPERAVPDTVKFKSTPEASGAYKGLYKGQVSVPFEETKVNKIETNHGPLHIINSEILFARAADGATSGSYVLHEQTWTEECYDDPTSAKAIYEDYMGTVSNAKWTFSAFTNAKKFNTVFKGNWDMTLNSTKGGVQQTPEEKHETDYFYELMFSNFNKTDGTIILDGHKYTAK